MKVLLVSPEVAPVSKVGGIADGIAGLAKCLRRFGHEVVVAAPRHPARERIHLEIEAREPVVLADTRPGGRARVGVGSATLDTGVALALLEIPGVPEGLGQYGSDIDGDLENARRFGLFARAVVEIVRREAERGAPFEIVHAHEWPAAMVLYLMRGRADLGRPITVLGIHTLAFQGIFPPESLVHFGLDASHFRQDRVEFYGRVNLMKAGIVAADAIVAVSLTYAREILTPELGELLDGVMRTRADALSGIVNGIDVDIWDPRRDPALAAAYAPDDVGGKAVCKAALLREIGLVEEPSRPLLVSVGRIFEQKGSDLLNGAIPAIVAAGASVAIAGAGDPALESALRDTAARFPGRVRYVGFASEELVHRILAAGDLFVMPSRFEPCGLVQLYAQRYGTVPIARRTGGLCDTIADASADLGDGSGFLFDEASAGGVAAAVRRGLDAMGLPGFPDLQRRIMEIDVGWGRAARRYEQLYRGLLRMGRR